MEESRSKCASKLCTIKQKFYATSGHRKLFCLTSLCTQDFFILFLSFLYAFLFRTIRTDRGRKVFVLLKFELPSTQHAHVAHVGNNDFYSYKQTRAGIVGYIRSADIRLPVGVPAASFTQRHRFQLDLAAANLRRQLEN